jgi:hypothetical protein
MDGLRWERKGTGGPMALRIGCLSLSLALIGGSPCFADEPVSQAKPEVVELSGILRRPVKWTPQLEIVPAGVVRRIDLKGSLVEGNEAKEVLKDGQAVKVWGAVRTYLHQGGTPENPSPFPPQWMIQLEVTKVEKIDRTEDLLRVSGGRWCKEHACLP